MKQTKKQSQIKSKAKAAGIKSMFVMEENVLLTAFGRGNTALMQSRIESDNAIHSLATGDDKKFDVTDANDLSHLQCSNCKGNIHYEKNTVFFIGNMFSVSPAADISAFDI